MLALQSQEKNKKMLDKQITICYNNNVNKTNNIFKKVEVLHYGKRKINKKRNRNNDDE